MNSGNNLGNWLVSSPARGTYNSITCSLTANDIVPPICGSLEQNCVHGWLVSALPRGFLPPLMTFKTSALQNISILTSGSASRSLVTGEIAPLVSGRFLETSVKCVDTDLLRLPKTFFHQSGAVSFRFWPSVPGG